ncbi:RtcB family protein [Pseudogracilibacillus auburnensis]|uniref:RtcB family protein n=1 Tax=Pseudogracilibacillus auburnensis TaxID=1494959 RepID=UPI001A95EC20|nr:RtcB family protein [Pseudogracilibacillus auburnensis]MBO1005371.1 RtcB family protein [Pseudogracilibacillus auburnensis]
MKKRIFGNHEEDTIRQFHHCLQTGNVTGGVLCADGHYGYSQPVGGVVVYDGQISPSGVGYDIACGNKAVKTNLVYDDIKNNLSQIMDEVEKKIPFGFGKKNPVRVDHEIFDDSDWDVYREIGNHEHDDLKALARAQLGTTGSGNHYVDILIDEKTAAVWVGNHFGSRGLGHRTATGFLNLANDRAFSDRPPGESMETPPTLFELDSELGQMYFRAMNLAGRYAYAGRDHVINQVLDILNAKAVDEVHNHHNFAWKENHFSKEYIVVRKGATPAFPGQRGFVGGSMADISVILRGVDSEKSREAFYSTVHGAGRIMSRTKAAGRMNWRTRTRRGGAITEEQMKKAVEKFGVELRGAGTDESPFVYRKLQEVLDAHKGTIEVLHILKPIGVVMASD